MDAKDYKSITNNLTFYRGVIEDNNDPDKLGRVQVRIFGIHPDDLEKVPTATLPWAELMGSTTLGLNSGIGISSIPNKGTYVWIFFEALDWNKPVVMGAIYGIAEKQDEKAFSDPDKKFPMDDRLKESDINRLARVEKISDTAMDKVRKSNITKGVSTSTGKTWDEPEHTAAKAKYPDNTVIESKSGHIIEIDDTKGNERIQVFHKSGTYTEMQPKGDLVTKVVGEQFHIVSKDSKETNLMSKFVTVNADYEHKVGGYEERRVGGDQQEKISGKQTISVGGAQKIDVSAGADYTVGGTFNIKGSIINLN